MLRLSLMTWTYLAMGERGRNPGVRSLCEFARELEVDGLDWITMQGHDPQETRKITDGYGLKNVCYTFFSDLDKPDAEARRKGMEVAKESLEIAHHLGADKVMVALGGQEGFPRQEARRHVIEAFARYVPLARSAGITVTVEDYPTLWAPFLTSADMNEAVAAVPGMKITFDSGNCLIGGEQPLDMYRNCKEHVVHVHFKDLVLSPKGPKSRLALDGKFYDPAELMGEGIVDFRACLQAMEDAGYEGYVNFEYEGSKYTPFDAARKGIPYLRGLYDSIRRPE